MAKSIIHEAPNKFQSIKEIALKTATEEKKDGNKFYKHSGLELIFQSLIEEITEDKEGNKEKIFEECVDACFIEYATHISTMNKNELDSFILIWDETCCFEDRIKVQFKDLIDFLREQHLTLFNHPDFYLNTSNAQSFISFISPDTTSDNVSDKEEIQNAFLKSQELKDKLPPFISKNTKLTLLDAQDTFKSKKIKVGTGELKSKDMKFEEIISPAKFREYRAKSNKALNNHFLVHKFYHELFAESDKSTVLLALPVLGSNAKLELDPLKPSSFLGISALFVFLSLKKECKKTESFIKSLENWTTEIAGYIKSFTQGYTIEIYEDLIANTKKQAIKAAISQVMARNTSHNIGSHVMNKLINGDKLKEIDIVKFHNSGAENNYLSSSITFENMGQDVTIFNQLAIFNNYVKCRMDYLSDITFGTPLMQTTKKVFGELFKDFDKVRLLLENISGLSHFLYSVNFTENDKPIKEDNLSVALPNDILGSQALYNIIENVIRNTAKHSKGKENVQPDENGKKTIIFTINIKEIDLPKNAPIEVRKQSVEYYEVEIFDNIPVLGDKVFEKEEDKKNYFNDVFDKNKVEENAKLPVSNIDYLVYRQNKNLNATILQDDNSLRASCLGLIEMEASACYLRKLDITNIEDDKFHVDKTNSIYNESNLNIIKAFEKAVKIKKDESYLGYRFFMLRPAEVLIVTDNELIGIDKCEWLKVGVKFITIEEFKEFLSNNGVFNHQFLVYDSEEVKTIISKSEIVIIDNIEYNVPNKTSLPIRQLKFENICPLVISNDFKSLELLLWTEWEKVLKVEYNFSEIDIANGPFYDGTNPKEKNAVLLDHLGNDSKEKDEMIATEEWKCFYKNPTIFYLDALSSKSQEKLPSFNGDLKKYFGEVLDNNKSARIKLIESVLSKILVIDERIQEATSLDYMTIPFEVLYEKNNVIVPLLVSKIKLSNKDFDETLIREIKIYIDTEIKKLNKKLDFLLIHYSILERMFNSDIKQVNFYLSSLSEYTNIIVTSGRGTPEKLTKDVRFVNLSPVITSFVEIRSKYLSTYLLHSTRKSNR